MGVISLIVVIELTAAATAPVVDRQGDPLPPNAFARLGSERLRHGDSTRGITYSPDGQLLVSVRTDHSVTLWDADTGKRRRVLESVTGPNTAFSPFRWLSCVAVSPDGKTIIAGESDPNWKTDGIHFWDATTGKHLGRMLANTEGVRSLAFTPDGKAIVATGRDKSVRVWAVADRREQRAFAGLSAPGLCVAIDPKGTMVAALGEDGLIVFWDLNTGKKLRKMQCAAGCESFAWSGDGKMIVVASTDRTVGLYDPTSGRLLRSLRGPSGAMRQITISRDGGTVAASDANRIIYVWETATDKQLATLRGSEAPIAALALSPDGKTVAAGGGKEAIHRWDVAKATEIDAHDGHKGVIRLLSFTADGKTLLSAGWDNTARLWDVENRIEMHCYPSVQSKGRAATMTADGRLMALPTADGAIVVSDIATDKQRLKLKGHPGGVTVLAFAPDGKTLVSGGFDNSMRIWDATNGVERSRLNCDEPLTFLAFSPDGNYVAQNRLGVGIRVVEVATGNLLDRSLFPMGQFECVAFSSDGHTVASGSQDDTVFLWDRTDVNYLKKLQGHGGYVMSVAFSPDGRTVAAGSWQTVRLWEVSTGLERGRFDGFRSDVTALAFAPDGQSLAAAADSSILLLDVTGRRRLRPDGTRAAGEINPKLWETLGQAGGAPPYQAIWALVAAPNAAVRLLDERLKEKSSISAEHLAKMIAALDSDDDFETREKTELALSNLGSSVGPALRKALDSANSFELRRRLTRLVENLAEKPVSPDFVRRLRAIEALEKIGTTEARRLLQRLAKETDDTQLAEQARQSLTRLKRRDPATP